MDRELDKFVRSCEILHYNLQTIFLKSVVIKAFQKTNAIPFTLKIVVTKSLVKCRT